MNINDYVKEVVDRIMNTVINSPIIFYKFKWSDRIHSKDKKERKYYRKQYIIKQMSFKKNPTTEELQTEVEKLQTQVVEGNARYNALKKQYDNHPALRELEVIKSKWWFKLITWSW